MLAAVLACFAAGLLAPAVHRRAREATGWLLGALAFGLLAYFFALLPAVAGGEVVRHAHAWVPGLQVDLTFLLDGLSLVFSLLITGLGGLIVIYAGPYLKGHRDRGRFFLAFMLFMGAMLGLVLADNLITLFVFWELTSFASYLLIGFDHEREAARRAALQALLTTGLGGLAMLAGFVILGTVGGSFELSELAASGEAIRAHALYPAIVVLVLAGAFTKSAQFPFHYWLPNAMEAPTPVSAYLHSATMVKAGVYLVARTDHLLGGTPGWTAALVAAGGATMVLGSVLALRHTELKRILAYSTIMALGTLVLLIGIGGEAGAKAAAAFLVVHAFYKATLFLTSGAVDHETGTRDVTELGGLRRAMPITATAAVLAGLSMAALPPLFGFIGKELVYEATLGFGLVEPLVPVAAVLAFAFTVTAAGIVVLRPFFGRLRDTPKPPHEAPFGMWLGPAVGAATGLLLGVWPAVAQAVVGPAASAIMARELPLTLTLWHGLNPALGLSAASLALGAAVYPFWHRLRNQLRRTDALAEAIGPDRSFDRALGGLTALSRGLTSLLQGGSLRAYLYTVLAAAVVLPTVSYWLTDPAAPLRMPEATYYEWIVAGTIAAAGISAAFARSRLLAVAALGVVGFGIALLYVFIGAPDLAMTQFLVETLTVIIILLVIRRLPRLRETEAERSPFKAVSDAVLALGSGALVTGLLLAVTATGMDPYVSDYFVRESVPGGHGRNIVNVILVDFRALDTLGEITVLATAGLGVFGVIHLAAPPTGPALVTGASLILKTATRWLLALLLLFAILLLWRGHNLPGGGFIGGLVSVGAFALYGIAFGWRELRRLLRVDPRYLIGAGLAAAVGSGLFALTADAPFLTGMWAALGGGKEEGGVALGTPLLFDVGVFLVVNGFALTVILNLERSAAEAAGGG